MFPFATTLGAALALAAPASDPSPWMGWVFGGRSIQVLGGEDTRYVLGAAVQHISPHPRLRFRRQPGELVLEATYHTSHSRGASQQPPNVSNSYALLAMGRYTRPWGPNRSFFELGWGLQYANRRTVDLSGRLSSTPTVGGGIVFDWAGQEWWLALRLQHVSNAGFEGNNQGQNQLLGMVGFRF